jgi:hypothetical protein
MYDRSLLNIEGCRMAFDRWRYNNKILGALINHSSQRGENEYMDVGHGVMKNLHNADSGKLKRDD